MTNTTSRIAERLTVARALEVRQIYARSRIMVGDEVTDLGLDSVVPPGEIGKVREIRGRVAFVDWNDGTSNFEDIGSLRRVASKFEHPLPDPSMWTPRPEVLVRLGDVDVRCGVARSAEDRTAGLQKYAYLPPKVGLLFPYDCPQPAYYHMGTVKFPIDILFVQPDVSGQFGRIAKIVDNIQPGTPGTWGERSVLAVVEVAGGFCLSAGIEPGEVVSFADMRTAQEFGPYELSSMEEGSQDLVDGYGPDDPQRHDYAPEDTGEHNFDSGLPVDDQMYGADDIGRHYEESEGYDPMSDPDQGYPHRPGR